MYGRAGLDRFRKAQSLEPFSVKEAVPPVVGQIGEGQSTWQPPEWATEPRPGVYYLQVLKEGQLVDRITLDKRRNVFGRQSLTCDYVLDHQSVSRQHAALVPHKNGSIYVIDLGSAHGTFVANERVTKDTPVELEVGQSLRFAASTRTYVLRKDDAALFPRPPLPSEVDLPPPPDPSDEEAVVAYNTLLNRYGLTKLSKLPRPNVPANSANIKGGDDTQHLERASKRIKKARVSFRDQVGGELVEVVGISDGVHVETEPGPIGVKEGQSLVGKYGSLVQTTVIPKGKEQSSAREANTSQKGMTEKLQQLLNSVKTAPKGGIYDDLYGDSYSGKMGTSWAYPSLSSDEKPSIANYGTDSGQVDDDEDDLFGD
ncbi:PREDICTED: nuclear inhibitor of protein phosphatase 1 [Fragaria vesca subsp. vesca]|uniref:nuclear inhibitor of protein phosphatase 1 n=1 Tax=Fragaria vesca subsp. vesca TaxID=101020 RepID=UPI0002C325F2|nr:PREDICTED: nuclear inhibitor of protein phosphatase 1 [Fragaria vesca subsp. vesca]